jgi:CubicO group peptidase (beta-lactamase class C family)
MRLVRAFSAALLIVTVAGWPTAGQEPADHPRVAQALELARVWLEAQRAYDQIPGVSAAIVHDQRLLWVGGFGQADLATGRPAGPDTIYSICSISKW